MSRHLSRIQKKEVERIIQRVYILKSLTEEVDDRTQTMKELSPRKQAIRSEVKALVADLKNLEFNL